MCVIGLSRHAVNDAATALKLLNEGIQRRSSAATYKNGHSSRSHAVFTVQCTAACVVNDGLPRETVAKLHLVDLAGRCVMCCIYCHKELFYDSSRFLVNEQITILSAVSDSKKVHSLTNLWPV